MFDTNVFNHLVEGRISAEAIPSDWEAVATHLQWDEINATPDQCAEKREQLRLKFKCYVTLQVPTESAAWGVSKWGEAKWTAKVPNSRA